MVILATITSLQSWTILYHSGGTQVHSILVSLSSTRDAILHKNLLFFFYCDITLTRLTSTNLLKWKKRMHPCNSSAALMWSENGGYHRGRPKRGCCYHGRQAEMTQTAPKKLRLLDHCALTATLSLSDIIQKKPRTLHHPKVGCQIMVMVIELYCCMMDGHNPAFKLSMKTKKASVFTFHQAQPLQIQCRISCVCVCLEEGTAGSQ